ncbi:MAG: prepilin-type N-terminal cleavage/methylation domain-containing protein [Candidatus Nanopelagicales bacterium]|nr:prepilin-type N-terminal cleavage/methylation domain-containing protein [Candidatus Nanopelagicales bacterium]
MFTGVLMLTPGRRDGGFTLVELTISIAILGIVMAGVTAAMLLALKSTTESKLALGESADLQFGALYFPRDVRSADTVRIPSVGQESSATCVPDPGNGDLLVIEFSGDDWVPQTGAPAILDRRASFVSWVRRTGEGQPEQLWRLSCSVPLSITASMPVAGSLTINTGVDEVIVGDELSSDQPPVANCVKADRTSVACGDSAAIGATLEVTQSGASTYVLSGTRRTQ